MTGAPTSPVPIAGEPADAALQHPHWRIRRQLSSVGDGIEHFLVHAGYDRGAWLTVAFALGIALWFVLDTPAGWVAAMASGLVAALAALAVWRGRTDRARTMLAAVSMGLALAAGVAVIWGRSEIAGADPIARPSSAVITGRVLERIEQPAEGRVRLVLAIREPGSGRAIRVRINLPVESDDPAYGEGALLRLPARLMPPAPPMLPGGYDFARAAWFQGLAATGSTRGRIELLEPARPGGGLAEMQRRLSAHVRGQLEGSPGGIAAALASGDRGAITAADERAMRDAGLTHLLSISGVHVSAVIAAAYLLAIRLLALWPWLALRLRLPIAASAIAALAGLGYTLLTGAEVPTVRSCIGAVLVLLALVLGREPLSLRLVAVAAGFVLLVWPESLVNPSFQMSFAAVIAIVALHTSGPVRAFLAPREEGWLARSARRTVMLLATGAVIELALMPVVLFHFHRAGVYGALANVIGIPLTTFVIMPLIALALLLDVAGLGASVWWLAGMALEGLLALARFTAAQPGAVRLMPQMDGFTLALFVAGGLWLGLWRGRMRLLGLVPAAAASLLLAAAPVPDVLVSGDGRHVAIAGEGKRLLVLRDSRSAYIRDNLLELSGREEGALLPLAQWKGAECSPDACIVRLRRAEREWRLLITRSHLFLPWRALVEACRQADIVVSDRRLPDGCAPRWLKADAGLLNQTGGLAIDLSRRAVGTVAQGQGAHGWWRGRRNR